jgi:hypothetical protein
MGLDMYAYAVRKDETNTDFSFTEATYKSKRELKYWRKHNRLHGWMEKLYREKGGDKEFNCQPVRLTIADIRRLSECINEHKGLDITSGFFFGDEYEYDTDMKFNDCAFIISALNEILDGYDVYYDSWW